MTDFTERLNAEDGTGAQLVRRGDLHEGMEIIGKFTLKITRSQRMLDELLARLGHNGGPALDETEQAWLRDVETQGMVYEEEFFNTVMTLGKNLMLDQSLAGAAYTVTGPFLGLISSTSYSAISAADTSASHAGWLEAGNANTPTYTSPRKTMAWSAASGGSKALSSALSYAITGTGTIKGAAAWIGSGAVSTIDSTAGTLLSAGLFTGGDRAVLNGDTVNVSYSMAL